jgi:hypothetical protein
MESKNDKEKKYQKKPKKLILDLELEWILEAKKL